MLEATKRRKKAVKYRFNEWAKLGATIEDALDRSDKLPKEADQVIHELQDQVNSMLAAGAGLSALLDKEDDLDQFNYEGLMESALEYSNAKHPYHDDPDSYFGP